MCFFGAETTGWLQGLAKRVVYARDFLYGTAGPGVLKVAFLGPVGAAVTAWLLLSRALAGMENRRHQGNACDWMIWLAG